MKAPLVPTLPLELEDRVVAPLGLFDRGVGYLPVEVAEGRLHLVDAHLGVGVGELAVVVYEYACH